MRTSAHLGVIPNATPSVSAHPHPVIPNATPSVSAHTTLSSRTRPRASARGCGGICLSGAGASRSPCPEGGRGTFAGADVE